MSGSSPSSSSPDPVAVENAVAGIDCVVTHHRDPFRSGVARFNQLLAARLGVPVVPLSDSWSVAHSKPLISLKPAELSEEERELLAARLEALPPEAAPRVFLHDWRELEIEQRLVDSAEVVYCSNHEYARVLAGRHPRLEQVWVPGLVADLRTFEPVEISVFSFGMAHKLRADAFARLKELLEASGRSYSLYFSNANHETVSWDDSEVVYEEIRAIFPRRLYFMGTLSDVAVHNQLREATYFAAFFEQGVRANNTTVASAMEHGAVVITNLDGDSPPYYSHMENLIDIGQCDRLPDDPLVLRRIAVNAMETAREMSWEALIERLGPGS